MTNYNERYKLIESEQCSYTGYERGNTMVKNKTLLLLASFVWLVAGFNIVRIGILVYIGNLTLIHIVYSVLVFIIFWFMVFNKLVNKHTKRIQQYMTEKQYFWNFFDMKSFIIMAFMMTMGITIRVYNLMPETFIAVFYTGLGIALSLAGIKFAINFFQYKVESNIEEIEVNSSLGD